MVQTSQCNQCFFFGLIFSSNERRFAQIWLHMRYDLKKKRASFYILGYPFELNKYRIFKNIFILFQKFGNLKS